MTRNQLSYWTLQEDKRKNLMNEKLRDIENQIAKEKNALTQKELGIKAKEANTKQFEADTNRESMKKKVNENVWKPLETISNNAAKVLGGIL